MKNVPAEKLEQSLQELRGRGDYEQALAAARSLLLLRQCDPRSPSWQRAEAEWTVRAMAVAAGLEAAERMELAWADRTDAELAAAHKEARYAQGVELIERQIEIRGRLLPPDCPDFARSIADLAVFRLAQGELREAEDLLREALEKTLARFGEEHPLVQEIRSNLGSVLQAKGDDAGAESLFRQALAAWREAHGNDHPLVASALNNLAMVRTAQGDYAGAEALLREALAIWRRVLGDVHPDVATSLVNLAQILQLKGDHAGAYALHREALEMKRKLLGPRHPEVALTLSNLALLLQQADDPGLHKEAEQYLREALATTRGHFGDKHRDVATLLNNLAVLLLRTNRLAEAEARQRESLDICRRVYGDVHREVARGLHNLASILRARGEVRGAEELCLKSLEVQQKLPETAHRELARSFGELGRLRWTRGDLKGAEEAFSEQARVFEAAHVRAGNAVHVQAGNAAHVPAGNALGPVTFQQSPYNALALARLHQGKEEEAWEAAERALARSLKEVLGAGERTTGGVSTNSRPEAGGSSNSRQATGDAPTLIHDIEWVRRHIPQDAAMVGWVHADAELAGSSGWGYVIRRDRPVAWEKLPSLPAVERARPAPGAIERFRREVGGRPIGEEVDVRGGRGVRAEVRVRGGSRVAADVSVRGRRRIGPGPGVQGRCTIEPDPCVEAGRAATKECLEALLPHLAGVRELIVVPSGALVGLPLEALPIGDGSMLVDRFAVSYAPSATIHAWLSAKRRTRDRSGPPACLAIGDPALESGPAAGPVTRAGGCAGRLPSTRSELEFVAGCHSRASRVLVGDEATGEELLRMAETGELRRFEVVHIATHAVIDGHHPERSTLVLSRGDRAGEGSHVTAGAIARDWKLDADLVALSACETGLGRKVPDEGYIGFAHAFFQAGARSVLASLWQVEDRSASLLMRRFYENWVGGRTARRKSKPAAPISKAAALREAKRWLRAWRDEDGGCPYAYPYYWAGFVLIGVGG